MKRFSLAITLFLTCVTVFGALVLSDSLFDKRETKTNRFNQLYSIEPESLLDTIQQGSPSAFSPIDEAPPFPPVALQIRVPWTQENYLQITNALFQSIWNDTLADWQLSQMIFGSGCADSDIGFQYGILTFFKNEEADGRKSHIQRVVNIDARNKSVYIAEDEYYPAFDWSSIDSINNEFSANEILQIAENAGGEMERLSVKNACDISILLAPNAANYEGWWINYSQRGDRTTLFRASINPSTGELDIP